MIKNKTSKSTENNYITIMIESFSGFLGEILTKGGDAGRIDLLFNGFKLCVVGAVRGSPSERIEQLV